MGWREDLQDQVNKLRNLVFELQSTRLQESRLRPNLKQRKVSAKDVYKQKLSALYTELSTMEVNELHRFAQYVGVDPFKYDDLSSLIIACIRAYAESENLGID